MNTMQNACDNELIKMFQSGNEAAFETLLNRHKDKIFTTILYLAKDRDLAEDLFQEVFIKIVDTFRNNKYKEEGKFIQWAIKIAHNLYIDHFRKNSKNKILHCADSSNFEYILPTSSSADSFIAKSQTYDKLRDMIEELPFEQREVIVLRHYGDFSFKEISHITGCGINTCLGRMRYALTNLRKMVEEKNIVL